MRRALFVILLLSAAEAAWAQVVGRVPFDAHPFKLYDASGGERETLGIFSGVRGPKEPGFLWDYEHVTDGSGWNGRNFVRFHWWDFDVSGVEEEEIGFFFSGASLAEPPGGWRDGAEYFVRMRVRVQTTPVPTALGGATVNNKLLITNNGGTRMMVHMRTADGSACGAFDPSQYPPQDWVSMRISRNIDGPDEGYCANIPVPRQQWVHLQYSVRYGAAGSAFVKAWVNNDNYGSPNATDMSGDEWPQVGMNNNRWQLGAYISDPSTEDVVWDMMDFEVAATFDPNWASGGTAPADTTAPVGAGLVIGAAVGEAARVSWTSGSDPESGIAAYRLYRGLSSDAMSEIATIPASASSYTDSTTSRNTTYFYSLTAVNGVGLESAPSVAVSVLTGDVAPAAPAGLAAISDDAIVTLDWMDGAEVDLAGYRVYRGTAPGGPYAPIGGALLTASAFTDTSALGSLTYYYVATAVDLGGHESVRSGEVSARPTANLVGWWQLDDGTGTSAADSSGHGLTGTLRNGPLWVPGLHATALSFDGVDDHVNTTLATNLTRWTVAVWVRSPQAPANVPSSGPVHRNSNFQINWNHEDVNFRGSVALRVGGWHAASFGPLAANTWYHLAGTYDGETLRAYKNGVLVSSNTNPSGNPSSDTTPVKIGRHAGSPNYFRGLIDDVRIYDGAIGVAGISALARFDETPPLPPAQLTATANGQAIDLGWTAAVDLESGINAYRVHRGAASGSGKTQIAEVSGGTLTYRDTATSANTAYFYQVTGINGSGQPSPMSPEAAAVTADVPPLAPTGLAALGDNAQVTLDWNDNVEPDVAGYRVYRGTSAGQLAPTGPPLVVGSAFTDLTVTNGTAYFYAVSAVDQGGHESPLSAVVSATPKATEATLVAHWMFDEGTGTAASDSSGHDWTGTLRNGTLWATGVSGSGITFDGVDDNITTTFTQDLANWTVAVWVRSPAPPNAVTSSGPVHRGQNFQINWNHPSAGFRGAAALRIGRTWHGASFGSLEANRWYHLVATYDGETLHAYKDGVLVSSNTAPSGLTTPEVAALRMGREANAGNFFNGSIDEVRLYGRALAAAEIAALYGGPPQP